MKILKLMFVMLLVTVLLAACAPAVSGLMGMPEEGRLLIVAVVTALFTAFLVWLSALVKFDLKGYAAPLAAVVSPLLITIAEHYLALIPAQYDDFVMLAIHFLFLLATSLGLVIGVKRVTQGRTRQLLNA